MDTKLDKLLDGWSKEVKHKPFSFKFSHDWSSFVFWRKLSWRGFTLIKFDIETDRYSRYLKLDMALLGLHFHFDWWREHKPDNLNYD